MTDGLLQHKQLDGITDYTTALDTLCSHANHQLQLFEKDFDGLGYNTESRYLSLRHFLLANPTNRLLILAHDTRYLSASCPRMMMLLRQFDSRMCIRQTSIKSRQVTTPFSVADHIHYIRRPHFNDPRGFFALNDPEQAHILESLFMEMWSASNTGISATKFGL